MLHARKIPRRPVEGGTQEDLGVVRFHGVCFSDREARIGLKGPKVDAMISLPLLGAMNLRDRAARLTVRKDPAEIPVAEIETRDHLRVDMDAQLSHIVALDGRFRLSFHAVTGTTTRAVTADVAADDVRAMVAAMREIPMPAAVVRMF